MHHVHTRTVTSNVTTKEPVSSLSPAVLFPFFPPPTPSAASPTGSTQSLGSTTATSTTADSSCDCHALESLPAFAIGPSSFISLSSANSHQPLVLPLPQPPPPPVVSSSPTFAATPTHAPDHPLMVFSHGSTQVDTTVPSLRRLQRTLYSWSQLSDYTPKHCWELPAASHNTSEQREPQSEQGEHSVSISSAVGRICAEEALAACPGHAWVNFTYHMQVKQWQEELDDDPPEVTAVADSLTHANERSYTPMSGDGTRVAGANSYDVQLAPPSGALLHRRRQSRQPYGHGGHAVDDAKHAADHARHLLDNAIARPASSDSRTSGVQPAEPS